MGDWKATKEAYHGNEDAPEEKVICERNKMCIAQALIILHRLRDTSPDEDITRAFDAVFEWIDGVNLFLGHLQSEKKDRVLNELVRTLARGLSVERNDKND